MDLLYSVRALLTFRQRLPDSSRHTFGVAGLLTRLIFPAAFVVLALVPIEFLDRMPTMCVYRALFGIRCPGCGMTHAFCSVLHGHPVAAFGYNHLVVVAFPFFVILAIRDLATAIHDRVWRP
jgi:hypothetical protein